MSETQGLDFEKARQEADKTGWEPWEGSWLTVFHTHLQAQHQALLAAAVEQARREEREKAWRMTDNLVAIVEKDPEFKTVWGAVQEAVCSRAADFSMNLDSVRAMRLGRAAVIAYLGAALPLPSVTP